MHTEDKAALTPEFLREHLKTMAGLDLSEGSAEMHELFAGLVAVMNTLQPEGYAETWPAVTFMPMKE